MLLISHRRNSIEELQSTPSEYGIEIDLRSHGEEIILQHDPFRDGTSFESWLTHYKHRLLILNVKEEGLEERLIALMDAHGIGEYFFLDQSFPFMIKWSMASKHRSAVRISEYESIATAINVAAQVQWVWVDCFTRFPLQSDEAQQLKDAGLKLCIVSPELHQRNAETEIPAMIRLLHERSITPDAVCTKRPDLWQKTGYSV